MGLKGRIGGGCDEKAFDCSNIVHSGVDSHFLPRDHHFCLRGDGVHAAAHHCGGDRAAVHSGGGDLIAGTRAKNA